MRWWALLAQGFMAIRRSWQGLKHDEGQLAFHLASKLWGFMVSLSIRASWRAGGQGVPSKSLGGVICHPHHRDWKRLSTYNGQSPAPRPSPPNHTSLLV